MISPEYDEKAVETVNKNIVSEVKYASPTPVQQSWDAPSHPRKLWRKLDLLVLPLISMIFFLFSLVSHRIPQPVAKCSFALIQDRYSIGNARVAGLQEALHITDEQVRFKACS